MLALMCVVFLIIFTGTEETDPYARVKKQLWLARGSVWYESFRDATALLWLWVRELGENVAGLGRGSRKNEVHSRSIRGDVGEAAGFIQSTPGRIRRQGHIGTRRGIFPDRRQ